VSQDAASFDTLSCKRFAFRIIWLSVSGLFVAIIALRSVTRGLLILAVILESTGRLHPEMSEHFLMIGHNPLRQIALKAYDK